MLKRWAAAGLAFAALLAWSAHWTSEFMRSRVVAERAMDELQRLVGRGVPSPRLEVEVEQALEQSHRALLYALGGPALLIVATFLIFWLWSRSQSRA